MVIKVKIIGAKEVTRVLRGLPRRLNKEISLGSGKFMKAVQKSAKLRAPKDTRKLRDSIKLKKLKNGWILAVQSPYGIYQEEGFKPHWIHTDMMKGTKKPRNEGFVWVSGFKPFVRPALEHNLSNLSSILHKSTKRAILGKI